jgi:hypothetical protein
MALDLLHRSLELAGGVDDGIARRQSSQPFFRPTNISSNRERAEGVEFSCRYVGTREPDHFMPAFYERAHHGPADRACTAEYENAHAPSSGSTTTATAMEQQPLHGIQATSAKISFRGPLAGHQKRAHAGSHDLADEILREIADDERVPARARRALS